MLLVEQNKERERPNASPFFAANHQIIYNTYVVDIQGDGEEAGKHDA